MLRNQKEHSMKKLTHLAATLALGAACALPVLAQDTGTTGASHGNTTSQGEPTTARVSTTAAPGGISHTISASDSGSAGAPSTNTMGAGPADTNRGSTDSARSLGWMGLLGLAGLLGLRSRR
jgi:MYXO-CTERM domain-containing protein